MGCHIILKRQFYVVCVCSTRESADTDALGLADCRLTSYHYNEVTLNLGRVAISQSQFFDQTITELTMVGLVNVQMDLDRKGVNQPSISRFR